MVQTTDMERSVVFYRDTLGLPPGYASPYWSDFAIGSIKLGIHPMFDSGRGGIRPFSNTIVCLATDDLVRLRKAI